MIDSRFWLLVSRHLAGEASVEEEQELQDLVNSSEEIRLRYEAVLSYWGKSKQREDIDVDHAYGKLLSRIHRDGKPVQIQTSRSVLSSWVVRLAASVVILLGLGLYFFNALSDQAFWVKLTWDMHENSKGERSKIVLADGSMVWLNAESKLTFPETFSSDTREVYLTGEAFFDVAKNPAKPFIIHLKNGDVRVLGTSFNVKAFEGDGTIETSVLTGKVAFIPEPQETKEHRDTILLTPNQKAVYQKLSKITRTASTNSNEDRAWIDGTLVFKSERLDNIATILERTYGKKVILQSEAIKSCRITGTFRNNTLEEVIMLISQTRDYQYSITNEKLLINGTGCSD